MEHLLGLLIGVGLSAACGLRVFLPLMGMSIAALSGHTVLSSDFAWIGTWPALLAFTTATVLEIATYYVPWADNLMDALMTPAAVVAGTLITASMVGDLSPFLKWSLAAIAGGGVSGIVQGGTVALRAGSSGTTGGLTNPILSTIEMIGSLLLTVLAFVIPFLCLLLAAGICALMITKMARSAFVKDIFSQ